MLAKRYKLPVQNSRQKIGQTFKSRYFLIKIFASRSVHSRVGVVISRKVAANAVARNRIKRIVFDFFQKNFLKLPVNDYLVIVSLSAGKAEKENIIKDLTNSLISTP